MLNKIIRFLSSDKRLKNILKNELKSILVSQNEISVLDIGSSDSSRIEEFNIKNLKLTLFDIKFFKKNNDKNVTKICGNVKDIDKFFHKDQFDIIVALDLIEHLDKNEGKILLDKINYISKNKVLIYTPNGYLPQKATPDNPYQAHKSGWTYSEFKEYGYEVYGMLGLKYFRGSYHKLKEPVFVNYFLSLISYYFTNRLFIKFDAALLAIKRKTN